MQVAHARLRPVRLRRTGALAAGTTVAVGLLAAGCGDDGPGDTARFCSAVQDNLAGLVTPPATLDDVDDYLALYRRIGDVAPLAIEPQWQALVTDYETASTVDPADPASVQRAAAQAYATERSAVAVRDFLLTRCNVDLGPVTTIVPPAPAAPALPASGPTTTPPG